MNTALLIKTGYYIITLYEKTERVTEKTSNKNVRSLDEMMRERSRMGSKRNSKRLTSF